MGLFSKEKKYTPDEILDLINALPEEDRAALKAKFDDLYKAEDEREIDKIEEEKADSPEVADEKAEDVKEESEEVGKDVDEIEDKGTEDVEENDTEEKPEADVAEHAAHEAIEAHEAVEAHEKAEEEAGVDIDEKENTATMIKELTDKVNGLEALVAELTELKRTMDEYVTKQKDTFGYKSGATDSRKAYEDMTADELKAHILHR